MNFIIDEDTEKQRIDIFLADYIPDFSRSKLQALIKDGHVLVNSKTVRPSYVLKSADVIEVNLQSVANLLALAPENIPLEVVWEDDNMAVINKPSGMLTHPTPQELSGTLVNALLYKYGELLSDINGDLRRGIVHRLDRNTSGLLMIAKNNKTHEYLVQQMKDKAFCKKYIAIVKGVVEKDVFEINAPIGRHLTSHINNV